MYVEESGCFDPCTHVFSIQEHTYLVAAAALELQFQQLNLEMEQCYNNHHHQGLSCDQSNWGEMNFPPYQNQEDNNNFQQQTFPTPMPEAPYLTTPDLLSMFPLPRCSQSSLLPPKSPNLLASLGLIDGKETKHFASERQRRMHLNDKYKALKSMVPNPSKNDRASVVKDAIGYINELKRGVNELKLMLEKKRCSRDRIQRQRSEDGGTTLDAKQMDEVEQSYNGNSLRSSWLQRRSKNTEIDVWIVDDKVTVKLVQQKRINCLLFASKVLDDLQLDLHHVAGGLIGDYYSFLFNSKISEGSTVYASAIAKKLIEVVDIQYAAIEPTNSY